MRRDVLFKQPECAINFIYYDPRSEYAAGRLQHSLHTVERQHRVVFNNKGGDQFQSYLIVAAI